jgi:hypothetical protein
LKLLSLVLFVWLLQLFRIPGVALMLRWPTFFLHGWVFTFKKLNQLRWKKKPCLCSHELDEKNPSTFRLHVDIASNLFVLDLCLCIGGFQDWLEVFFEPLTPWRADECEFASHWIWAITVNKWLRRNWVLSSRSWNSFWHDYTIHLTWWLFEFKFENWK